MVETIPIYKSEFVIKTQADLEDLYSFLYNYLVKDGWEGIYGKDRFEYYYYHRYLGDLWFINIKWKAKRNYWEEEPKVDWVLDLTLRTVAYDSKAKKGEITVKIEGALEIEEVEKPIPKTKSERFIVNFLKITPQLLLKKWKKTRIEKQQLIDLSARDLFIYCETLKKEVVNFLKGVYK